MTVPELNELMEIQKLVALWAPCGMCKAIKDKLQAKIDGLVAQYGIKRE